MSDIMRVKDRKWLQQIADATDHSGGMYSGLVVDMVPPTVARRLAGFIESYSPHNPIHKDRWVIVEAGRRALAEPRLIQDNNPTDNEIAGEGRGLA
jgi:hypothetical protein